MLLRSWHSRSWFICTSHWQSYLSKVNNPCVFFIFKSEVLCCRLCKPVSQWVFSRALYGSQICFCRVPSSSCSVQTRFLSPRGAGSHVHSSRQSLHFQSPLPHVLNHQLVGPSANHPFVLLKLSHIYMSLWDHLGFTCSPTKTNSNSKMRMIGVASKRPLWLLHDLCGIRKWLKRYMQ